jgi:hypothetical protein
MRATSKHPRLGEFVVIGVTLALAGLLLATFQHALETPPLPGDLGLGIAPH